jgi:hypothetical protein
LTQSNSRRSFSNAEKCFASICGVGGNINKQKALAAALDGWYAEALPIDQQRPMYDCGSPTMGDLLFVVGKLGHIRGSWVALKQRKVEKVPDLKGRLNPRLLETAN